MGIMQRSSTGVNPLSPELSIVFSCFNQAEILESAVRACFQAVTQDVSSFEILIINDGSTDGSVRTLDRLRKEFLHLRVTHQLHSGYARATRRGYDLSRGRYVFQVDLNAFHLIGDFSKFWEMRKKYSLVSGYQTPLPGRFRSGLRWFMRQWIKLWFGADLVQPDSSVRLCRREFALQLLQQIPPDFERVDLSLALLAFRDAPSLLLELQVGRDTPPKQDPLSDFFFRLVHSVIEVAALSLKRTPAAVVPSPLPQNR